MLLLKIGHMPTWANVAGCCSDLLCLKEQQNSNQDTSFTSPHKTLTTLPLHCSCCPSCFCHCNLLHPHKYLAGFICTLTNNSRPSVFSLMFLPHTPLPSSFPSQFHFCLSTPTDPALHLNTLTLFSLLSLISALFHSFSPSSKDHPFQNAPSPP